MAFCQSLDDLPWRAQALRVSVGPGLPPTSRRTPPAGNAIFRARFGSDGAWYTRDFALPAWGAVLFDIRPWRHVNVELVRSTVNGAEVVATAMESTTETWFTPYLQLPDTGDPTAPYIVPWGADQISVGAPVTIIWSSADQNGVPVVITEVLGAGGTTPVKGATWQPDVAAPVVWRIIP